MSTPPAGQSKGDTSLDIIFSALADENRRHVLLYFQSSSQTVASVGDLVAYTLAQNGTQADPVRIVVKFHHVTLPLLDDAGLLDFDRRNNCVRYQENPLVEEVLSLVAETEDRESTDSG